MDNQTKYAWYSKKQFDILVNKKIENKQPYIYYINSDDEIVQITEITNNNIPNPNFDDVIFKGIVKSFYSASNTLNSLYLSNQKLKLS